MNLLKWLSPFFMVELCTLWGGKGSSSPAPDYVGAANAQAAASQDLANQNTWANRPTQNTPWGSTSWTASSAIDPATGKPMTAWTQNQTLDPALQAALDDQLAIQAGRSDIAGSFMDRVRADYASPFNWGGAPGMANTPSGQYTASQGVQTSYGDPYRLDARYVNPSTRPDQSVAATGQNTAFMGPTTSSQGGYGMSPTGQDTSAPGQTTFTTNEPAFAAQRQQLMDANFARMQPTHARQQDQLETQLINQGHTRGGAGWNEALKQLQEAQAGERWNALEQSGQEQARMQQMLLGQQQQAFGQDVTSQNTQNQALMNLFQQQQGAGQMGLSREQQAYNQMLGSQNQQNQALQNLYQQQLGSGQFGLNAQQQAFMQSIGGQQAYNQALAQQQGLDANRANFYNQAMQQQFGQNLGANQQNFNQMMQMAQFQNQNRQQFIAEEAMRRGMSLNELNALLTGQQVNTPQMPGFNQATMGQAPQLLNAATAQGQYNLGADKLNMEADQALWGGIGKLAGAAGMFMSDIRLKSNIKRVGTHPIGVGVYEYDIFGSRERGVMAQEVLAIRPDLVYTTGSGYLMVNYGGL